MNSTGMTTKDNQDSAPGEKPARKWLSKTFNAVAKLGLGAAVGLGVKTAVLTAAATASAPALAIAGVAALAGGLSSLAASYVKHKFDNHQLIKTGQDAIRYDWKKKGTLAFGLGALGGGVFSYFSDTISSTLGDVWDYFKTPEPVTEISQTISTPQTVTPPEPVAAMAGACLADDVQKLVNTTGTSDAVKNAAERACSGNAKTAAQAAKDLGFHLLNGVGIEKAPALAVAQLTKAAEAGNIQAIRDMAFLQFHGAAGVPKNVEAALEKMETVMHTDKTGQAMRLMEQWTGSDTPSTGHMNIETPASPGVEPAPELPPQESPEIKEPAGTIAPSVAPDAVEETPAPDEGETPEPSAPMETVPAAPTATSSEGCKAVFTNNDVEFHCPVNDTTMVLGDQVQVIRPALLVNPAMMMR